MQSVRVRGKWWGRRGDKARHFSRNDEEAEGKAKEERAQKKK